MEYRDNVNLDGGFGLPPFATNTDSTYMNFRDSKYHKKFEGLRDLERSISKMDKVSMVPLYREGNTPTKRFGIVSEVFREDGSEMNQIEKNNYEMFGKMYDAISGRFSPVQDDLVFGQLVDALGDSGYTDIVGAIRGLGNGTTIADAFIRDEDASFKISDYSNGVENDYGCLGIRVWNGHNGKTSVGLEFKGVRKFCTNGLSFGDILGTFKLKHMRGVDTLVNKFSTLIGNGIRNIDALEYMFSQAHKQRLSIDQYADVLWGIGFGKRHIEEMINPAVLAPEVSQMGITALTTYNAVSAFLSHSDGSGKYSGITERRFNLSRGIIESPEALQSLIQTGTKARLTAEKKLAEAQRKAEMPTMKVRVL